MGRGRPRGAGTLLDEFEAEPYRGITFPDGHQVTDMACDRCMEDLRACGSSVLDISEMGGEGLSANGPSYELKRPARDSGLGPDDGTGRRRSTCGTPGIWYGDDEWSSDGDTGTDE